MRDPCSSLRYAWHQHSLYWRVTKSAFLLWNSPSISADHDDQKNRMVSGGGRGSGGRVVCSGYEKLSKICYCQQINFYVKHLIGTRTVLQQRDFFASYALAASFPLPVSYPFRFSLSRKFLTLLETKISK